MTTVEELEQVMRSLPQEAQNRILAYARTLADEARELPTGGSPEKLLAWAKSVSPAVTNALAAGASDSERLDLSE